MADLPAWRIIWEETKARFARVRLLGWPDVLIMVALGGLLAGVLDLGQEWTGPHRPGADIELSPWALLHYTFYSLARGMLAYAISLGFTLVYGYWAASDRRAERILIPLLDILQSIPVLGFLPGVLLALESLFPSSNLGVELASVVMIFTGQAWNMTFSFYHSLRTIPTDQLEVATIFRFSWWQRLKWVQLPFATLGLVWNSMMSMAGGWFFLMISESFRLGDEDFRLPGIGSYMSVAVEQGRVDAMLWALGAMVLMIVALDQLLWRPVVVWAQKFRVEEGGSVAEMESWFLTWLRRAQLVRALRRWWRHRLLRRGNGPRTALLTPRANPAPPRTEGTSFVGLLGLLLLLGLLSYGCWQLVVLLQDVTLAEWGETALAAGGTLGRVLLSTALGTLWALPAGLAVGLSPRLSRLLQPVIQVLASFPAPMLFPLLIAALRWGGISLNWGSILLMLLGTQWYILFNVIAGAMAIPADLREAATGYRLSRWQRFRVLYLPAVFPYLVTGWVTAAGGAWNASIVAEYVTFKGEALQAWGLGAQINQAAEHARFPLLAASVLVMAVVVVAFNRLVWRRFYHLAEQRFSLSK